MLSAFAKTRKFLSITNKNALERVARAATLLPRDHLLDATFSSIGSRLDPPRPPPSPTTRAPTLRLLGSGARRVAGGNDSRVALGGFERRRRGRELRTRATGTSRLVRLDSSYSSPYRATSRSSPASLSHSTLPLLAASSFVSTSGVDRESVPTHPAPKPIAERDGLDHVAHPRVVEADRPVVAEQPSANLVVHGGRLPEVP